MTTDSRLAAVILTGGGGTRLGGVDKAALTVRGRTLLEHALLATADTDEVVVVGPRTATERPVTWTREQPPGVGPAAGLLAGLAALTRSPRVVVVLAVDMPGVAAATVQRLVDVLLSTPEADGACLVDSGGRRQWLAAAYRYDALLGARPQGPDVAGIPVRRLLAGLRLVEVPAEGDEARDVDTWDDLRRLGP